MGVVNSYGTALRAVAVAVVVVASGSSASWAQCQSGVNPAAAPDAQFGYTAARDGNVMLVGAPLNADGRGLVLTYERIDGAWTLLTSLLPDDLTPDARFGVSIDIDGNFAIIGAQGQDIDGIAEAGAVYVYKRSGSSWQLQTRVQSTTPNAEDFFGASVSLSGSTMLVGAPGDDDQGLFSGTAYVFRRSGPHWSLRARLTSPLATAGAQFGVSVSLSGGSALIGAYGVTIDGIANAGAVFGYEQQGSQWSFQTLLTAPLPQLGAVFGRSVATDGNRVVVGSIGHDANGVPDSGAAFLFARAGAGWEFEQELSAADGQPQNLFGNAVDVSESTVVVGAIFGDGPAGETGSMYVFRRAESGWIQTSEINGGDVLGRYGNSVRLDGTEAAVGAPGLGETVLGRVWTVDLDPPACSADVNHDCVVDANDLEQVTGAWGPCEGCPEDLDGDGAVGLRDLLLIYDEWGACGG